MFLLEGIKCFAKTDNVAVVNPNEGNLTFLQLEERSEAFGAFLLNEYGDSRAPVVLYGNKENDILCCMVGALKAGRPYVPIDITIPPDRINKIVQELQPDVVVCFQPIQLETQARVFSGAELRADVLDAQIEKGVDKANWVKGTDQAYILFTSGTTGAPKGIPICVDNIENFNRNVSQYYADKEGKRMTIMNQVSYSFDASVGPIYIGLSSGATLVTVDNNLLANPMEMFPFLNKTGPEICDTTPSFIEYCFSTKIFSDETFPSMTRFILGGEVLTKNLCRKIKRYFPNAEIYNNYGPTETTVFVTLVHVTDSMIDAQEEIPIGAPLDNVELRLMDGDTIVENDGENGELIILGDSTGRGYYNPSLEVNNRFFIDEITQKRGYHSGDLCYRRDGLYYFIGRIDTQVKIHGYRIELEDIEQNLGKLNNVVRATVVPMSDGEQDQYLAAFVLLEEYNKANKLKEIMTIKKQAAALLPSYMVPRVIKIVEQYPLNTNGKVDRQALQERYSAY